MKFITHLLLILISTNQLVAQGKITQAKGIPLGSAKSEVIQLLTARGEKPQNGYEGNMIYTLGGYFGGNKVKDTKYIFNSANKLYEISFLFSANTVKEVETLQKEITQNLNKKYGQPYATDSLSTKQLKHGNLNSTSTSWGDPNEKGRVIFLKKSKLTRLKGTETNFIYLTYKDLELDDSQKKFLEEKVDEDY